MKRSYGGLLACMGSATLLALAGCSSMENMTDTTTATTTAQPGYYTVKGRYYHCHENGRCHNVRHSQYLWRSGLYREGTPSHYHRYPQSPR